MDDVRGVAGERDARRDQRAARQARCSGKLRGGVTSVELAQRVGATPPSTSRHSAAGSSASERSASRVGSDHTIETLIAGQRQQREHRARPGTIGRRRCDAARSQAKFATTAVWP